MSQSFNEMSKIENEIRSPENSTVPTSKITTPLLSVNKYPESYFASPLEL
jgi:hypothetical protein